MAGEDFEQAENRRVSRWEGGRSSGFDFADRAPDSVVLRYTHKYLKINDLSRSPDAQRAFFIGFFKQYSRRIGHSRAPSAVVPSVLSRSSATYGAHP